MAYPEHPAAALAAPNSLWRARFLGRLEVRSGPRLVTRFPTRQTAGLFAYLVRFRTHPHPRESLVELFWPESEPERGRASLSQALTALRRQLEGADVPRGAVLIADRDTIHLREGAVESDVEELDRLLRRAAAAPHPLEQRRWYSEALELYQGEFLPGWYEDWCLVEREHLEGKYRAALRRLLTLWEQDGNQEAALECALEIARREPLDEEARREVLRLLLALGRVEEALREYLDLEGRLRDMLQTRPSRATLAWRDLVLSPQSDMFRVPIPVETRRAAVRERPAGLPRGAWTFLAVETLAGDTALHRVSAAADRMRGELLRREPGRVVAAFPGVAAALEAALACYREAEGPERHCLRAGLHTAEVREAGPQGLPPLLEKLLAAGHPGQLLASEATLGLLRTGAGSPSEAASPGAAWRDLGLHRFGADGAEQWVRLFQGCHPVLPDRPFPPLRGATRPGTALAPATNAFFGREQELALLHEWVRAGPEGGRLLTVTGPGGAGKTRVTLEALRRVEQEGQRIVWYVPLQSVRVSAGLPEAVCSALGCPSPSFGSSPLEQAAAVLNSSPSLLVLDNLEQLWGEATAALLIRLLAQAPTVSILVTSRQRLELEGEQELELAPLPTPGQDRSPETLRALPSVALFLDRARAARPDFPSTGPHLVRVAELCERLEGLPLAIELAAARGAVLGPAQILARLEARLDLLSGSSRALPERHRSLRAALEWSHQLLGPDLQRCFSGLSVFRGGWSVEAVEAVLGEAGGGAPLDALQRLAAASLIRRENDRGSAEDGPRFWMLETIREFAAEKLAGEARVGWEQAHARYFLALAEREAARLEGTAAPVAAAALALEQDNLLAALGTLQADPAREPAALQLLAALSAYWVRCCRHETARAYLPSGLTAAAAARQPRLYGQVLRALGTIAWQEGAYCEARDHLERALELARRVVDLPGAAGALQGLGALAADQERVDEARERLQETLTLRRQCNDRAGCVAALNNLGGLAAAAGDLAVAREQYDEALGLAQELDSAYLQGGVLASLGGLVLREGDAPTAERLYQASLGHFLACGHRTGEAHCLLRLARLAQQRGERETALRRAAESLAVWREIRHAQGIAGAEALHATLLTAPSPASVR